MAASFDRAWRRLTGAFDRYRRAPRDPSRFDELVDARHRLDDARADMRDVGARHVGAPENESFVEPGLGTDPRSAAGKVAALVFVVIAVAALASAVRAIRQAAEDPLTFGAVTESSLRTSGGGRCVWTLAADLRNTTDGDITVTRAWVITSAGSAHLLGDDVTVPAEAVVPVRLSFLMRETECPAAITDVTSGRIRFNDEFTTRPDLAGA